MFHELYSALTAEEEIESPYKRVGRRRAQHDDEEDDDEEDDEDEADDEEEEDDEDVEDEEEDNDFHRTHHHSASTSRAPSIHTDVINATTSTTSTTAYSTPANTAATSTLGVVCNVWGRLSRALHRVWTKSAVSPALRSQVTSLLLRLLSCTP